MQIKSAREGIVTEEMKIISKKENVPLEKLMRGISNGRIVILKNIVHSVEPVGIGEGLRVKINVNIGTSMDHNFPEEEIEKYKMVEK